MTDGDSNMFIHHDIIIPASPLCTAWLDCPLKGGDKGMNRSYTLFGISEKMFEACSSHILFLLFVSYNIAL